MTTILLLKGNKLAFECSSGIRNNGNGDFFDTEVLELTNEAMGEMVLCKLTYMLENGYPECYDTIADYMVDWSMDMPWTKNEREATKKHMRNHPSWKVISKEFERQYPECELI